MSPAYDYSCTNLSCQHKFEAFHRMDELLIRCPRCNMDTLQKELTIPYLHIKDASGNMTLGALAEQNSKKLSKEEKAKIEEKYKTKKNKNKNKRQSKVIPWWDQNYSKAERKKVTNLKTKEEKTQYIMEGKLP